MAPFGLFVSSTLSSSPAFSDRAFLPHFQAEAHPIKVFCNYCSHHYLYSRPEIRRASCADYSLSQTRTIMPSFLLHLSNSLKFSVEPLPANSSHDFRAYSDAAASGANCPSSSPESIIPRADCSSLSSRANLVKEEDAGDLRAKVAKLGLSAILAYGLFDGVTYTLFFVLAFLGFERSTGKNPAANLQALLGVVVLMWTGNNFTRPFRVAGAAALAPFVDKALKKIQRTLNLSNVIVAFMLVVVSFASLCFSVVGLLILSRWGKP